VKSWRRGTKDIELNTVAKVTELELCDLLMAFRHGPFVKHAGIKMLTKFMKYLLAGEKMQSIKSIFPQA
jgi:hypothetical protein